MSVQVGVERIRFKPRQSSGEWGGSRLANHGREGSGGLVYTPKSSSMRGRLSREPADLAEPEAAVLGIASRPSIYARRPPCM